MCGGGRCSPIPFRPRPYRGAGRPVASYALECLMDKAAHELGLDPAEFRRRNMIPKSKMPYKLAGGFEYDCGDFEGVMNKALSLSDWSGFSSRQQQSKARGRPARPRHRHLHRDDRARRLRALRPGARYLGGDDGSVTLRTASHNHGQGHEPPSRRSSRACSAFRWRKSACAPPSPATTWSPTRPAAQRTLQGLGSAIVLRRAGDREERHGAGGGRTGERAGGY